MLAGVLVTLPQVPVYRASGAIEIQGLNDEFLNLKSVDATAAAEYTSETYLQTQIRLLRSDVVLDRVEKKLTLSEWPEYQPGWGTVARVRRWLGMGLPAEPALPEVTRQKQLLERVRAKLQVQAAGLTRVVEISFEASSPQRAADFVNTLAQEYINASLETRWKTSQQTSEWLGRQLAELRAKMERSDQELQSYAQASGLMFHGDKENVVQEKLRQVQTELSRAQADRMNKQARFELARQASAETLPEVLNDGMLREYQTKLTELRRQYAELSAALTPAHPKVQRVQAQINEIQGTISKERSNIVNRIQNEYLSATEREKLVEADFLRQASLVNDQASKAVHYNVLKREVESSRALYDAMSQRVKEAGMAAALRNTNVRIVDTAGPPAVPAGPNMPMNALVGLLAGLVAGFGYAAVREQTDRRIHVPGDPVLGHLPELGVIPAAKRSEEVALATLNRKPSLVAESIRAILASIVRAGERTGSKVLIVTSPSPGDGKSTISSNLAVALAEIERRVLLIDGDLRKPSLQRLFDVTGKPTLVDLLRGAEPVNEMIFGQLLAQPEIPNLFLLPAGELRGRTTSLLHSPRLHELLARFRESFDVVLIDTPPMLHLPDARIISQFADGVVLVIRAGRTTQETALSAAQRFAEDGTPVLGTILNSWSQTKEYGSTYGSYGLK
ncbi:MAG: polysaccharide biosynthesis tyrosine autokinase [Bryobacterales bacterium]|nr:polysaccharide biosynthesis tyrosine autokinase [Bryobacterales bacterium]